MQKCMGKPEATIDAQRVNQRPAVGGCTERARMKGAGARAVRQDDIARRAGSRIMTERKLDAP
jgi:hypothetical protein